MSIRRLGGVAMIIAFSALVSSSAHAEALLPLRTETAKPLPSGTLELAIGSSYFHNLRFPMFTPRGAIREQDLVTAPEMALRIGVGDWVEIQASYELLYLDERNVEESHTEYGGGDARLFTKVRLFREGEIMPALALRFGTKLPDANKDNRLGTDETDFGIEGLASKDFGIVATHLNLGILIAGNPGPGPGARHRNSDGQDDLFTYSVGLASRPFGSSAPKAVHFRLLAEVQGLAGSHRDFDNDRAAARIGGRVEVGGFSFYTGASVGLESGSEDFGVSAGLVYAFDLGALAKRAD
jgi:hypothetical protein